MWLRRIFLTIVLVSLFIFNSPVRSLQAQNTIHLTIDTALGIAMENSYRVREISMDIEQGRHRLKSRQAGLKSKVYMNLRAPEFNSASDYKWNSVLGKDEIIREDTRRWQTDLSIRQPVIILGRPTNGYLSLNNQIYRYLQTNGYNEIDYYNRYFVKFEQPLFSPNYLKNDVEDAKLDLENRELEFISDIAEMIEDISEDYYDILLMINRQRIYSEQVETLSELALMINEISADESSPEVMQIQMELANSRDQLNEAQVSLRRNLTGLKQRLRIDDADTLEVEARIQEIVPITVDRAQAVAYGLKLQPNIQQREINRRRQETRFEETKARDSFRVDLEMTYGQEKHDKNYRELWDEQDNSYSVSVRAYVPIWDWGERKERIKAEEINIKRTDLDLEEERHKIVVDIENAIDNLEEYQTRALSMAENLKISQKLVDISRNRYRAGEISITDLLTILNSRRNSKLNQLDVNIRYRESLLNLMMETYYDYENDIPLVDRILELENNNS
jgi:outer membrane protein